MPLPASARLLFNNNTSFIKSSTSLGNLPNHELLEIAFSGRSNVGKSSLINAITTSTDKKLAETSKTPGRTQTLNFFKVGNAFMLVDLPGYGFAKAKRELTEKWGQLNEDYLLSRQPQLRATYVLIDSRRGILPIDFDWMCMLWQGRARFKIVLTKSDRISPKLLETNFLACRQQYEQICGRISDTDVVATSSKEKEGLDALKRSIYEVLKDPKA
mmetsp:Transcript_46296/g.112713  ORF Transcript_46296/g.112713 Transcript_46296/m.112713 type:complete len:215 (-) Transcript_46296:241-885(-)